MISKNSINNMVRKLHLDDFIESHKSLLKDNRGGFLIPFEVKITDKEYERYRHLSVDWSIPPITKDDLPDEFSQKAVNTIDLFRRKTFNLDIECMIYLDIHTGNIVSCNFADKPSPNEVSGEIYPSYMKGMHIASVHNHPKRFCSPPSGKNFEMLKFDFEEYELIMSEKELWILESKEVILDDNELRQICDNIERYYDSIYHDINSEFEEGFMVIDVLNKRYGDFLLQYLNIEFDNIILIRRYLDD